MLHYNSTHLLRHAVPEIVLFAHARRHLTGLAPSLVIAGNKSRRAPRWRVVMWWEPRAQEQPVHAICNMRDKATDIETMASDEEGDRVAAAMGEEGIAILIQHAAAARYAALALVGPADADDAVQEALVRGWRAWATL